MAQAVAPAARSATFWHASTKTLSQLLGAVYHLWRIPSADSALDALTKVRAHPDSGRWHDAFAESVADEALQLVRPMTYSRTP